MKNARGQGRTEHADEATQPGTDERVARVPPPTGPAVAADVPDPLRRYAIHQGWRLIGTSDLEVAVAAGARAAGRFHPTDAWSALEPVFALYRSAATRHDRTLLREYVRRRDALGLRVWRGGEELEAEVELISTWRPGVHVVHVASRDPRFWRWRYDD